MTIPKLPKSWRIRKSEQIEPQLLIPTLSMDKAVIDDNTPFPIAMRIAKAKSDKGRELHESIS